MNKYLSLKITVLLAFYAIIISIPSAWVFYQHSYSNEMKQSINSAQQLLETVIETAAIASYLNQHEMAQEVVTGLAKNDIVAKVSLEVSDGQIITAGEGKFILGTESVIRSLSSPFSEAKIGELSLTPDILLIKKRAQAAGIANSIVIIIQTFIITMVAMLLFYRFLTRPIKQIANRLHQITPGDDERLACPKGHEYDEIGSLISDTNHLLDSAQKVIEVERELREKVESLEIQYHQIFSRSYAAIFIANAKGILLTYNQSFQRIMDKSDFSMNEMMGKQVYKIFSDQKKVTKLIQKAYEEARSIESDLEINVAAGEKPIWIRCTFSITFNEQNKEPLVEGVLFDITERKKIELNTQHQAEHDKLTGLLNRQGAEQSLNRAFMGGRHTDRNLTILLLDLDGFKALNDTYGHDAGDSVLVEVSNRLLATTRDKDQVVRWGGDEFLIIINEDIGLKDLQSLGRKLVQAIAVPIKIGNDVTGQVGVSIGIASLTDDVNDLQVLIKRADQVMYEVKYRGKNNFCIYDSSRSTFDLEMTIY